MILRKATFDFAAIPEEDRIVLCRIAQLRNDLNLLCRYAAPNVTFNGTATEHELEVIVCHRSFFLRFSAGVIYELWQVLTGSSTINRKYFPQLSKQNADYRLELGRYFSKRNAIKEIRDGFAFHSNEEHVARHLRSQNPVELAHFVFGQLNANNVYSFAEATRMAALANLAGPGKLADQLQRLVREVFSLSGKLEAIADEILFRLVEPAVRTQSEISVDHVVRLAVLPPVIFVDEDQPQSSTGDASTHN